MARFLLFVAVGVLCLVASVRGLAVGDPPSGVVDQEQRTFLKQHWQVPIPPQGRSPARLSALEASLDPESCGVCHRLQYDDWKSSVHRK
ncbi:MAG: multiheme c-type cytochrome, partial [Candidatus Methylomirabilis sp.]